MAKSEYYTILTKIGIAKLLPQEQVEMVSI